MVDFGTVFLPYQYAWTALALCTHKSVDIYHGILPPFHDPPLPTGSPNLSGYPHDIPPISSPLSNNNEVESTVRESARALIQHSRRVPDARAEVGTNIHAFRWRGICVPIK